MEPPKGAEVFEGRLATFWFDESGILCAKAKPAIRTMELQKQNYEFVLKITNNQRVCLLSDTTKASAQDKETRDYAATEIPKVFKAMAVVSSSVMGRFMANIFLVLKKQPIPIKMFDSEEEAKEWLKQYL